MGVDDCPCLLVQDERQAALIELNVMEKKHRELQVFFLATISASVLVAFVRQFPYSILSCTTTHLSICILY